MEQREDIQFGHEGIDDEAIQEFLFKAGTPELEGPLTTGRAEALIQALSAEETTEDDIRTAYAGP